mmetsp:Transcript_118699/g.335754  ORF Transcript_118699/g.335754 Transcript_118699/m.335754 type:complete len:223 (-) Transcript_118699:342-1010(-)
MPQSCWRRRRIGGLKRTLTDVRRHCRRRIADALDGHRQRMRGVDLAEDLVQRRPGAAEDVSSPGNRPVRIDAISVVLGGDAFATHGRVAPIVCGLRDLGEMRHAVRGLAHLRNESLQLSSAMRLRLALAPEFSHLHLHIQTNVLRLIFDGLHLGLQGCDLVFEVQRLARLLLGVPLSLLDTQTLLRVTPPSNVVRLKKEQIFCHEKLVHDFLPRLEQPCLSR